MSLVSIAKILLYVGFVIWLLPPIRQFKGRFFAFFLILAFIDPIALLFYFSYGYTIPFYFYLTAECTLLISLLWKNSNIKLRYFYIVSLSIVTFCLTLINMTTNIQLTLMLFIDLIILFSILKLFITEYVNRRKTNLFILVLIFYQLTTISKFLNVLIGFVDATAFFNITSIAQIAFGLFFAIFREDNPRLLI